MAPARPRPITGWARAGAAADEVEDAAVPVAEPLLPAVAPEEPDALAVPEALLAVAVGEPVLTVTLPPGATEVEMPELAPPAAEDVTGEGVPAGEVTTTGCEVTTVGWLVTTEGWPVTTPSEFVWVRNVVKPFVCKPD